MSICSISHSMLFTQPQRLAFKNFYQLGNRLIHLAYYSLVFEMEDLEKWYKNSLENRFIDYKTEAYYANEDIVFGLTKTGLEGLKTMIALGKKAVNWYQNLPTDSREDFAIAEFIAALEKIRPSIEALDT